VLSKKEGDAGVWAEGCCVPGSWSAGSQSATEKSSHSWVRKQKRLPCASPERDRDISKVAESSKHSVFQKLSNSRLVTVTRELSWGPQSQATLPHSMFARTGENVL